MYRIVILAAVVTVAVTKNRPARAGPDECREAVARYNTTTQLLKRYQNYA
jgi:hypothetical protein